MSFEKIKKEKLLLKVRDYEKSTIFEILMEQEISHLVALFLS